MGEVIGRVSAIGRYPVKSMLGESPDRAELDPFGMVHDREWALRDAETGKLASAKRPSVWSPLLGCSATGSGSDVVVTVPDGSTHGILDASLVEALSRVVGRPVEVVGRTTDQGTYDSDWPEIEGLTLSGELEVPSNLGGVGDRFVDVDPLHFVTTSSLDRLAELAPEVEVDLRRFRPGFVIDTDAGPGWVEDDWTDRTVRLGEAVIRVGAPSPRCVMTTLAQGDLPRRREVLTTLAEHHRIEGPFGTFACLGAYASVVTPGAFAVGDPVELL